MLTFDTLVLLFLVAGALWFWSDSLKTRERVIQTCSRMCAEMDVQFLDQTISVASLRLERSSHGWMQLKRQYRFEFSIDGSDRYQAYATTRGRVLEDVLFRFPDGDVHLQH